MKRKKSGEGPGVFLPEKKERNEEEEREPLFAIEINAFSGPPFTHLLFFNKNFL